MDIQKWIKDFAAKLRKDFPEKGGAFAVVVKSPQHTSLNEGFEGDPTADTRPDFVKKDDAGWQRINPYNGK